MMLFNYENPNGWLKHNNLWIGAHSVGEVKLYLRAGSGYELIDAFDGEMGIGEYGEGPLTIEP